MTPGEFKAWFDGFTEAFEGRIPTKAQWGRIKDRVAEIDGKPVTERVYVDRYLPPYIRTYPQIAPYWTTYCAGVSSISTTTSNHATAGLSESAAGSSYSLAVSQNSIAAFNSSQAMAELGRAEAAELS